MTEKSIISQRFWANVTMTLAKQRRSFSWLEQSAGYPNNLTKSAKSKGTRVRLGMALRIAKVLELEPEMLIYGTYELKVKAE